MSKPNSEWTEMSSDELTGLEYTNAVRGWRNDITDAEVIVFKVEGTGLEDVTDLPWAVQHPYTDDNVQFAPTQSEAENFAKIWMRKHPEPENAY